MASADDAPTSAVPERDAVRIVPLAVPGDLLRPLATAAPTAQARMTYRGGPLLTSVEVFVVYWGVAWASQPLADTASRVDSFFDTILVGEVMDQLSEYGVAGQQIGRGRRVGRAVVTAPDPGPVVTDAALQQMLRDQLGTNSSFPTVDRNSLLFVYLPPGSAVVQGGSRSCQAFCGYHDVMDSNLFYAVVPYPGCQGCTGTLSRLRRPDVRELARALRGGHGPGAGARMVRRRKRRDRGHLRLADPGGRRLHRPAGVVQQEQQLPVTRAGYPGVWFQLSSAGRPCS